MIDIVNSTLAQIEEKHKVRILKIMGGKSAQLRLAGMGIIPGKEIEMIRNSKQGPIIIGNNSNKIMLGRGLAQKIFVEAQ